MSNLLEQASIVLSPTAYDDGKVLCVKPSDGSGDFDFSRNSSATRVNAQGLVEDVQILSSNLVQNPSFSEEGAEEVSNGSFSQEGSEEITNGDFNGNANGWNVGDWTYSNGKMVSNGAVNLLQSGRNFTLGKFYKITYTIQDYVSGGVVCLIGTSPYAETTERNENGVFTEIIECITSGSLFILQGKSNFVGSIDNVSCVEVGQNWNLGTGWSIGEDKAVAVSGASSRLEQSISGLSGKTCKISFTLSDYGGSGSVYVDFGSVNSDLINTNGEHIVYGTFDQNNFEIFKGAAFSGSITNISVKEVGMDWTLGTGWEIGNNLINFSNPTGTELYQALSTTIGKYKIKFDLNITSGTCQTSFTSPGTSIIESFTTNGTQEVIIETTSNYSRFRFVGIGNSDFTITNISVIEITDDTNLPRISYENFSYQDALGSELYDGNINQEINGGTWIDNGDGTFTVTGLGTPSVGIGVRDYDAEYLTVNKNYLITAIGDNLTITIYDSGFGIVTSGTSPIYFTPTTTSTKIYLSPTDGITATYSNISVKQYFGQEVVPNSGCGSLLFEGQSTNLIPYSEDFSQWILGSQNVSIIPNNTISPSGILNATKLIVGTSNNGIYQPFTSLASQYTGTMYIKTAIGTVDLKFGFFDGTNIDTDTITVTDTWTRFEVSKNLLASSSSRFWLYPATNGTKEVFIWGAMLEEQSYATSYIPTEGTTKTRNQDLCTNGGDVSLINSTEGTLYFEGSALVGGSNTQISLSDGTSNNSVQLRFDLTSDRLTIFIRGNGGSLAIKTITGVTQTDNNKIALVWNATNFRMWLNGLQAGTVATNDLPIGLNTLDFTNPTGASNFQGKTKCLAVFPYLTDQELTELTTI